MKAWKVCMCVYHNFMYCVNVLTTTLFITGEEDTSGNSEINSILGCGLLTGCGTTDVESSDNETPPTCKKWQLEAKSKRGRKYKIDGIGHGDGIKRGNGRSRSVKRGCGHGQVTKSGLKGIYESGR